MQAKSNRPLLIAIALGLWANVLVQVFPVKLAHAQGLGLAEASLSNIESDLRKIARGTCINDKIC
ncbi:MAG: hypothetical protein SFU84_03290 [Gemmatimonadales bacterium]|nr:hypothetical protein [Gemmatimonadales bacterium]